MPHSEPANPHMHDPRLVRGLEDVMVKRGMVKAGRWLGLAVLLIASFPHPARCATQLTCSVMGSGGRTSVSPGFALGGTAGQAAIGVATSPGFSLNAGFWPCTVFHIAAVGDRPAEVSLLGPGVPNPFQSRMMIGFGLGRGGPVHLRVIDSAGRLVRTLVDGRMEPGRHNVEWDGTDSNGRFLASGVYFVRFLGDGSDQTRRITLVR